MEKKLLSEDFLGGQTVHNLIIIALLVYIIMQMRKATSPIDGASEEDESNFWLRRKRRSYTSKGRGVRASEVVRMGNNYKCLDGNGNVTSSFSPTWATTDDGFGYWDYAGYDDWAAGCTGSIVAKPMRQQYQAQRTRV